MTTEVDELNAHVARYIQQEHLASLRELGVDLTSYLTQHRADQVIELRGQSTSPHLHVGHQNPNKSAQETPG